MLFGLTAIDKKIIVARLYDNKIYIKENQLDNYIVDPADYTDKNTMYTDIVNNCIAIVNA